MIKGPIALILGIRPDVIRASIIIREMRSALPNDFILIWSGQHYSDNLKDIFFRELGIADPDYELNIEGESDADLSADMISKLSLLLQKTNTSIAVFLGDTNTVLGTVAAAQLNIPIIHIEGCMRSYDWRMPEEKYRTIADHLSDRIYAYLPDYKLQGLAEGIPESNILVTGNPIVDVLNEYFLSKKLRIPDEEINQLLASKYSATRFNYLVMTCHRRENVENEISLNRIISLAKATSELVIFPAGYRTQKMLSQFKIELPDNIVMVNPIGYLELLELFVNSNGILTDSGTVVEEASILGIPSIQSEKKANGGLYMPLLVHKQKFLNLGGFPEGNITLESLSSYLNGKSAQISLPGDPCISGDDALFRKAMKLGMKHITSFNSVSYHFQEGEKRNLSKLKNMGVSSGVAFVNELLPWTDNQENIFDLLANSLKKSGIKVFHLDMPQEEFNKVFSWRKLFMPNHFVYLGNFKNFV